MRCRSERADDDLQRGELAPLAAAMICGGSKTLLITPRYALPPLGGRAQLSHLHRECLNDILGEDLLVHELDPAPPIGVGGVIGAMRGHLDGISAATERAIVARVQEEGIRRIFLNGSNLGRLARAIRNGHRSVEVMTFFHNVEARFFLGSLKHEKGARALGILAANYLAERMAVRNSQRVIAMSHRDSHGLRRLYGRGATDLLPLAIADARKEGSSGSDAPPGRDYVLFVGGAFYANAAGIRWFVREVAPHIPLSTYVVGHGLEALKPELECGDKVRIVGGVDWLADWYSGAKAIIAPIFDGSGMKTKVAEALMFGKKILGTSEAFSGYEEVADDAGWICNGKDDFIARIARLEKEPPPAFDPRLRHIYERFYSREAARSRLEEILK